MPADGRKIAHPLEQTSRDARRAACSPCDFARAFAGEIEAQHARATFNDGKQLVCRIEIETNGNAEAVAQRRRDETGARGGTHKCERCERDLDRACAGSFADHQIELEVLHRRIKNLLDCRVEAVDFVDEQHVARLEIGEDGGEIAGLGQHRSRRRTEIDAQFPRHDLRQGRLAKTRRTRKQHMVQRFGTSAGGFNEDGEILARLLLAHEFRQPLGPHARLKRILLGAGRSHEAIDVGFGLRSGHSLNCPSTAIVPGFGAAWQWPDWTLIVPSRASFRGLERRPGHGHPNRGPCGQWPRRRDLANSRA